MSNKFREWCDEFLERMHEEFDEMSDSGDLTSEPGLITIILSQNKKDDIHFMTNIHSDDISRLLRLVIGRIENGNAQKQSEKIQ